MIPQIMDMPHPIVTEMWEVTGRMKYGRIYVGREDSNYDYKAPARTPGFLSAKMA